MSVRPAFFYSYCWSKVCCCVINHIRNLSQAVWHSLINVGSSPWCWVSPMKVTVLCSVQCKTYACVLEGHLMGLTIDFSTGFICFDAATKVGYPVSSSMRQASCAENNRNCFQLLSAGCLVIRCQTLLIGDKLCLNLLREK